MRVIVTRPAAQAAPWVAALRAQGVDALALPLIEIVPPADPAPVQQAWAGLPERTMAFFVSANAVQHFFALRPLGAVWPAGILAAAPGPGTAAVLRAIGVPPVQVVEPAADAAAFDSESLWLQLAHRDWAGSKVLVVRGEDGRDWLAEQLRAAGATVDFVAAYVRRGPQANAAVIALLAAVTAAPQQYLWLFSSSEAVRHLAALWPGGVPAGARALATHARIAQAARKAGFASVADCAAGEAEVLLAIQAASIQSAAS
jgi:uroporphyrinogen-III synthase